MKYNCFGIGPRTNGMKEGSIHQQKENIFADRLPVTNSPRVLKTADCQLDWQRKLSLRH